MSFHPREGIAAGDEADWPRLFPPVEPCRFCVIESSDPMDSSTAGQAPGSGACGREEEPWTPAYDDSPPSTWRVGAQDGKKCGEHVTEHGFGQAAGIRVVAGAVVAVGEHQAGREPVQSSMTKGPAGAPLPECRENRIVCYDAKSKHGSKVRESGNFGLQKLPAIGDLCANRLVRWRHTPDGVGDAASDQPQAVVRPPVEVTLRQPEGRQGRIQEVAREVAGEGSAGAVRALQPRSQANNQERGVQGPKRRYRRIVPVRKPASLLFPEGTEPRA